MNNDMRIELLHTITSQNVKMSVMSKSHSGELAAVLA